MDLTSKDTALLEIFKQCLGLDCKISLKTSSFSGKKVTRIQFSDATLYRWLIIIGITPAKSKTIGSIAVPDKYFADFLRGEFDGDGHSVAYWDTRWHSSVSLYIAFTCGSVKHLTWLQETITRLTGASGIIKPSRRAFKLEFSKTRARVIYEFMYYAQNIPLLMRKKEKLDRQWVANDMSLRGIQPIGFRRNGPVLNVA